MRSTIVVLVCGVVLALCVYSRDVVTASHDQSATLGGDEAVKHSDPEREAQLVAEASVAIANGDFAKARVRLRVLQDVYPESAYLDQAQLFMALSIAKQRPWSSATVRFRSEVETFLRESDGQH